MLTDAQHYYISALITAIITSILLIAVFKKSHDRKLAKRFSLYALAIAHWSLFVFLCTSINNHTLSYILCQICHAGGVFIPITFLHFVKVYTKNESKLISRVIRIGYALIILISLTIIFYPQIFIPDVVPKLSFYFFPEPGLLFIIWNVLFVILVFIGFIVLLNALIKKEGAEKKRLFYFILANFLGYTGGIGCFLPVYRISYFPFPYGIYGVAFFTFVTAYAILRYQFLDIEKLVKNTIVFLGLSGFVLVIVTSMTFILREIIGKYIGIGKFWSYILGSIFVILLYEPVKTWLINTTDKFLFQKKYEYKQILKTFIDEVITVLNLDEVVNSTLKLLGQTLHPYTSSIFILNKVEDKYQLYSSRGLEAKDIIFTSDSKLIAFLKNTKDPAVIKQINGIVGVSPEIAGEMAKLNAVVVLPLMLHNDLIGFISLGKKKSDEDYTKDDLDVLLDLARTESVAVGNAQLLQEAAQSERRAAIGTMAAGIHHEIGNPLNIINTKIQVFLTAIQRGFYKDRSKEDIIEECQDILNETINQTNRIADITRRLSNFAKPSKEFKPELVSVPEEIEEALFVVGHELELEKINIKKEVSSDANRILADKHEMQQILFNIFRNASQAIERTGTITIRVLSTTDDKVHIEIEDTGKGIPEEKIHRIFEPFFTTKGPNKGTGLGLSIVRQLVWRNKGEISFRSQAGVGTTFILEFPKGI